MLPKKIYLNYIDEDDEYKTWSEYPVYVHCDMQNREYTDLSQVWHNSKEEPEKGRSIISIGETGVSAYKWVDEWRCDWYSQTQPMCIRHNRAAKPLDTACSKYLKRHRRGK